MAKLSKTQRLVNALAPGKNVSVKHLTKITGLASISSTVNRLRQEGLKIYLNTRKSNNGKTVNYYRWDV